MNPSRCVLLLATALVAAPLLPAQDRYAGIPAAIQPFVDHAEISGAVMLVADRGRILHLSAVGTSDVSTGRPMRTDDLFWIASMTKPMTAVAVGILVDEGKLNWSDPVEKYLPEFRGQWVMTESSADRRVLVRAARPITIADLLTHTSGLGEYAVTDPHWSLAEYVKVVAREPLRFQPGSRWGYSTAGLDTAGRIVEVVSGEPYAEFMRRRIFNPLGMAHTTFWLQEGDLARYARSYVRDVAAGKLVETTIHFMFGGAVTDRARPALGGAGLFSTAEDVLRFYRMMLGGGELAGKRILSEHTAAEMTTPHTGDLAARPGMPWGYGFCVIADPAKMAGNAGLSPGTFGHGGAFGTQSWADPKTGRITILMLQRDKMGNPDDSPVRRAFAQAIIRADSQ